MRQRTVHIAHYGGWLTESLDRHCRRGVRCNWRMHNELNVPFNAPVLSRARYALHLALTLMEIEERRAASWRRLGRAAAISRRRAAA